MRAAYVVARPEQDVTAQADELRRAGYDVRVVSEFPCAEADNGSLIVFVLREEGRATWAKGEGRGSPLAGLRGQQRELIQALFDNAPVMMDVFNPDGTLAWVNREFERVLGYKLEDLRNKDAVPIFYPDQEESAQVYEKLEQALGTWHENVITTATGEKLNTAWNNLRLSDGTLIGLGQDITARKQAERLRGRVIEESIQAQEEERRRLALELHDELGQSLATLLVGMKALEEDMEDGEPREQVRLLREITAQSVREVGRLARGLRPSTLDDLGFPAAIEMHVTELSRAQVLHVDLHMNGFSNRARMPRSVEQHLYRMVQEALTNVVKHARASAVSVVLRRDEDSVLAIVEDDGSGFDTPEPWRGAGPHDAIKLASIRERASLVNGQISIESVAGHGTTLYIQVPLPREVS